MVEGLLARLLGEQRVRLPLTSASAVCPSASGPRICPSLRRPFSPVIPPPSCQRPSTDTVPVSSTALRVLTACGLPVDCLWTATTCSQHLDPLLPPLPAGLRSAAAAGRCEGLHGRSLPALPVSQRTLSAEHLRISAPLFCLFWLCPGEACWFALSGRALNQVAEKAACLSCGVCVSTRSVHSEIPDFL